MPIHASLPPRRWARHTFPLTYSFTHSSSLQTDFQNRQHNRALQIVCSATTSTGTFQNLQKPERPQEGCTHMEGAGQKQSQLCSNSHSSRLASQLQPSPFPQGPVFCAHTNMLEPAKFRARAAPLTQPCSALLSKSKH